MKPTIRLGIAGALALLVAGAPRALAAVPPADSLAGRVVDAEGQPVAGALVSLFDLQRSAVTDSDGAFRLTGVPAGWYTVEVRHPGFAARALVVEVGAGGQPLVIDLVPAAIQVEPITVTATRLPISPAASALPSEALGEEALRTEHGVSLAHVLAGLPGVRSLETGEQIGKPVVRGLYGSRVLVLANGSRVEDYSWSEEDGPSADARTAGRVEVIRGPASVLYGSDAIGGVVNVVPAPLPDAGDGPSFVHAGYELYGATNNLEGGATVTLTGASRALGWRVTAIGRAAGNLHTPAGELDNTGFFALNGEAAATLRGAHGNTGFSVSHYGGEFHLLEAGGPPTPPPGGADQGGPVRKSDDERVQLTDDRVLSGAVRLETKAQWERHSLIEVSDEGAAAGGGSGEQVAFDLLLSTTSLDVLLHHIAGPLHGTVGASGLHQDNTTSGPITLVPDARVSSAAAFVFEEVALGSRWSVVAGGRADVRRLAVDSNVALGRSAQSRGYTAWSGDVGLVWRPLEALSVAANVGRAWRAPNLFELFANGPLVSDNRYVVGDPSLRSEAGTDYDAGVRWQGRGVRAEVAVFRNDIARFIYLAPTSQLQAGLPVYRHTQASARLEGGEVWIEALPAPSLSLRAAFDAVRGTNQVTGEPLPLMAPARVVLAATWFGARRARVGMETQIFARQTRLNPLDLPTGGHTLVDYALFDLTGGIERALLGRPMRFDLKVSNLLDTRYRSFLSRYKAFADDPGRNVVVRISVN